VLNLFSFRHKRAALSQQKQMLGSCDKNPFSTVLKLRLMDGCGKVKVKELRAPGGLQAG